MATLGGACLIIALALAVYGIGATVYGLIATRRAADDPRARAWIESGRRAVFALAGVLTIAFVVLEIAFVRSDFGLRVVADHSSTTTPFFYRLSALWSSQEGSLLLWVWLLSLWSSGVLLATRRRLRAVTPYATVVLLALATFFVGITTLLANPFSVISAAPAEGAGLNPLLRHPSMMIHPPLLYAGYTLFAVPFAFAVGALVARRLDSEWIAAVRRYALGAWLCLGIGILLGARWSYSELGWGGYWAWDPVENAALMPWLTGTAFLHSLMIQEKRGMLKVWNVSLVLASGVLAVLGTFLVRSGILNSIHAFGASTLGIPFLVLIGVMVAVSIGLVLLRRRELRSEHRLDSLLSREAAFMLNNLLLVALCFVVFWGTFFPLISEAVTGNEASVGPPWFDRYTVPLALALVALSGVGPLIAWRRATPPNLARNLGLPVAIAAATAVVLALLGVGSSPLALALFASAAFVVAAVGQEFWRGARARRATTGEPLPSALTGLVARNRHRYGGYLIHVGICVAFVGVAASSTFADTRELRLTPGASATVGDYRIEYVRPTAAVSGEKIDLGAVLVVSRDGRRVTRLQPSRSYFPARDAGQLGTIGRYFEGEATSEVGLQAGMRRDLWAAMQPNIAPLRPLIEEADRRFAEAPASVQGVLVGALVRRYLDRPGAATFRVIVSPLVTWIWLGGVIIALGALIALWPPPRALRRRAPAPALAPSAQQLGRARA